jgi:hypothetical protein
MRCCPGKKKGIKGEIRAPRMLPRQRTKGEREELTLKLQGMEVDELQLQGMEQPAAQQGMEELDGNQGATALQQPAEQRMEELDGMQEPTTELDGIEDRMRRRPSREWRSRGQWHELISINPRRAARAASMQ